MLILLKAVNFHLFLLIRQPSIFLYYLLCFKGCWFSCQVVSDSLRPHGACQAPLSMKFSRQKYWRGLPFPSPRDPPDPEMEPSSPAWQVDSLPLSHLLQILLTLHGELCTQSVNYLFGIEEKHHWLFFPLNRRFSLFVTFDSILFKKLLYVLQHIFWGHVYYAFIWVCV